MFFWFLTTQKYNYSAKYQQCKTTFCQFYINLHHDSATFAHKNSRKLRPILLFFVNLHAQKLYRHTLEISRSEIPLHEMKILKSFFMALVACSLAATTSEARTPKEKQEKGPQVVTIYGFGITQTLTDSVVYMSAITPVNGAKILSHGMLEYRQHYSDQLKNYVENTFGIQHLTSAYFFSTNRKKVEKKYIKVQEKLMKHSVANLTIKSISAENFHYKVPVIVQADDADF